MKLVVRWFDRRLGFSKAVLPIIQHPVPKNVNWWYVFGSATLVAFTVQIITGVALAFSYVPAPSSAYESLQFITDQAALGGIVRGIHYWGGSAMVVLIFIHMCRTYLMGSFKFPRELNWLTGVLLFGLTLGMAFTGQLLRWDQDAYWAVAVGANMAGRVPVLGNILAQVLIAGQTVGGATLTRFYATHVFLFPALMFGLIGMHLYLVIHHGISEPPGRGDVVDLATYQEKYEDLLHREGIPFWPDAAWRDVIFALAVGVVVLALAIVVGPATLGAKADPTNLEADPRPDWYFLWFFAILALIPPSIETLVIIGLPLLAVIALLALPLFGQAGERSPFRRPWAVGAVGLTTLSIATLIWYGSTSPWSPNFNPAPLPNRITQGLTGPAARGAQLFESESCSKCHTIAGTGGQRGPDLTMVGRRLDTDELTWRIANGGNNMPAFGAALQSDELDALVAFLAQLKSGS
jgi:ubiquinol-cytochrome c reductase cytochrome b subunit